MCNGFTEKNPYIKSHIDMFSPTSEPRARDVTHEPSIPAGGYGADIDSIKIMKLILPIK